MYEKRCAWVSAAQYVGGEISYRWDGAFLIQVVVCVGEQSDKCRGASGGMRSIGMNEQRTGSAMMIFDRFGSKPLGPAKRNMTIPALRSPVCSLCSSNRTTARSTSSDADRHCGIRSTAKRRRAQGKVVKVKYPAKSSSSVPLDT